MKESLQIYKLERPAVRAIEKLSVVGWFARKDA